MKNGILVGGGCLVFVALVWLLVDRRQAGPEPPPETTAAQEPEVRAPSEAAPGGTTPGGEPSTPPLSPAVQARPTPRPREADAPTAEEPSAAELPTFEELPARLRPQEMLAFGEYLGEALRDKLPADLDARVDDVDCSSVPCLLRVSARLQGPGEKPALASVVGIATDAADGDRPLVIEPGDDDRQRAVLTFTPSDRPELAPLFEAEAGRREAD